MAAESYDDCWLRYDRIEDDARRETAQRLCSHVYAPERSPQHGAVRDELRRGLRGLLGREPHCWQHPPRSADGFLSVGQPDLLAVVDDCVDRERVAALDDDGFLLTTATWEGTDCLVLTAPTDRGLVYGTFHLLRLLATGADPAAIDVVEEPATAQRLVNQWDEPFRDGVERGYAGSSIFRWHQLPDCRERYEDYARLLASIGINGIVLNDVNTTRPSSPGDLPGTTAWEGVHLLDDDHLDRVAALAAVFRRYGVRTYLAVNFAAPTIVGDLDTADPLDPDVEAWWERRVDAVYDAIPDFGGFLVKADSEGEPGPFDYGRSHAEGANCLARALAPHSGRVFWRAFVYHDHEDRAVQAGETFEPLDGAFRENVTLQVKHGPIDFQPREPVSTLFCSLSETNLGCELQCTQEYTGQAVHACYHGPLWEEVLSFDTHVPEGGTTLADRLREGDGKGLVGVANVGDDPSWFGHDLAGANLYAFGRLAWEPARSAEAVAREWARQTFSADPDHGDASDADADDTDVTDIDNATDADDTADDTTDDADVVETVVDVLLDSSQAAVQYHTGGLGLHHLMYNGEARLENHYDPEPEAWPEYHGASADGVGVDRTSTGSGYAAQYPEPIASRYDDPERCPEELLLFFHHVPWDFELDDGTTVIQRLYDDCHEGVETVAALRDRWESLDGEIDDRRHRRVAERFDEHLLQARRWRDALCAFFYEHAEIPDAKGRVPNDGLRAVEGERVGDATD